MPPTPFHIYSTHIPPSTPANRPAGVSGWSRLRATSALYFQFGPAFELTESSEDISVFATYDDGRIAGLMASYGDGKVAVCGPHPEADASWGDEVDDGEDWEPVTDLGVALLQELLSDNPVGR